MSIEDAIPNTQPVSIEDLSGTGTIAALNGVVVATCGGCSSVVFGITGTWTATLSIEATVDGINWFATYGIVAGTDVVTELVSSNAPVIVSCGGFSQVRVIATAYTSGTAILAWDAGAGSNTFQVFSPVAGSFSATVTPIVLLKGAQGSTGFSVQDLKDAGRTYITFTADAIAGVTSEALVSFEKNMQGTTTAAVTSYIVTNGKTFRIQSLTLAIQSGSALAEEWIRVKIRHNTAGATTIASALVYTASCGTNIAATAAVDCLSIAIPGGIEIYGNGTQSIGVSHISSATSNVESITLCGYEY